MSCYFPNLMLCKGKSLTISLGCKLQGQQNCLIVILDYHWLAQKPKNKMKVLGKIAALRTWLHLFVGDDGENNDGNICCPEHRCKCSFEDLSLPLPQCYYVTFEDVKEALKTANRGGIIGEIKTHVVHYVFDNNIFPFPITFMEYMLWYYWMDCLVFKMAHLQHLFQVKPRNKADKKEVCNDSGAKKWWREVNCHVKSYNL